MPHKSDLTYYLHIFDAIIAIEGFVTEVPKKNFVKNDMLISAVVRKLEIIGEAANKISETERKKHSKIPWRAMIDMRNVLIHEYFGVDAESVWDTIQDDLPPLKAAVQKVIAAEKKH